MILRPRYDDIKIICYYIGEVITGIGLLMLVPVLTGVIFREWSSALDFAMGMMAALSFGFLFMRIFYTKEDLGWTHGIIVVALSWLVATFVSAIPMYLSGHFISFLDACFDSMSGFATTGLTLIQRLDHASNSLNMWRHLIMYVGGQGIVVIALTFLIKTSGVLSMYVGEAREEKILPNVIYTARFIWIVSLVYLVIGTVALTIIGMFEGMPITRAFMHGMWIFMAAWDTGGFAPQSQNILYYHSLPFELITLSIMMLGALNFKLHYAVWTGNRKEIYKNIEIVTLIISILTIFSLCAIGLSRLGVYPQALAMFRKGFYQVISAHVGTGYATIYPRQFVLEWGGLAMVGTIIAMALGGCACSTAGGIKALRIGITYGAIRQYVKKIMSPYETVVLQKFHHIKEMVLEDKHLKAASIVILCYLFLYVGGAIVGMLFGYSPIEALFESVSATANVGLSCGITQASMPAAMKLLFIFQMWVGRLEFMSVFALIGFVISLVKGK